jgi:DNA-3-methyladenine glycosylase II
MNAKIAVHPDHTPALAHLRAVDTVMAAIIATVGPCELAPRGGGFHELADAIVAQQISIQAAAAIWKRLEAALGSVTPQQVVAADEPTLRAAGLSGQKARYLRDLAERVADGRLDLDDLHALDDDAAIAQLVAVKGIGRWTAEIYLLFGMGRPDILPADDLGLRYAVQQFYGFSAPPRAAEVRIVGERWSPHRSVAAWYLWRARRMV